MDFYEKFFGYFADGQGQFFPYSDNLGQGEYSDWRHWVWIIAAPMLGVFVYKYFRKNPQKARSTIVVLSLILIFSRLTIQILPQFADDKSIFHVLPFHLCSITTGAMGVVALFNIRILKPPIYTLGVMGGIATVLFSDAFQSTFINFYDLLGIIAHTLIIIVPLIEKASGTFSFEIKHTPYVFLAC